MTRRQMEQLHTAACWPDEDGPAVLIWWALFAENTGSKQWLVRPGGACEGLFAVCDTYKGLFSCTTLPAWMGSYSLTWMFLASSSTLSLATLVAIKPALSKGKRAIVALLLNVMSVAFCVCALIAFMLSIEEHLPEMVKFLGWAFYICCATVLYASVVSVGLGLVGGSSSVEPVSPHDCSGLPPVSP
ncbi:hypothetical protein SRHO_G00120410 [Serrasalmus rhombeus]